MGGPSLNPVIPKTCLDPKHPKPRTLSHSAADSTHASTMTLELSLNAKTENFGVLGSAGYRAWNLGFKDLGYRVCKAHGINFEL